MTTYRCKDGETLDQVCYRWYGRHGMEERVLAVNPGLADLGPELPAGTLLRLPELVASVTNPQPVRLWD